MLLAECLAIRAGLVFAMESGLRVQVVESDAVNAVQAIMSADPFITMGPVIDDIKFLLNMVGGGTCCHVSRKGNMVAHSLAQFAFSIDQDSFWLEDFPSCVSRYVSADLALIS